MAGKIRAMIDQIVAQRAKGNAMVEKTTITKLLMKGFDPSKYNAQSLDDAAKIADLQRIAAEFGVTL
jgi:hypothetical protein